MPYRGHVLCRSERHEVIHSCLREIRPDISGLPLAGWQRRSLFGQQWSCSDAKQRCSQTLSNITEADVNILLQWHMQSD